jgi:hypothetical protein
VYGEPPNAIAKSDKWLTNNEAEKIARLIARLPDLVEIERDRNKARSRRKPKPLRLKPVTVGDLIRDGKLLEVHCGNCRPARHLFIDAGSLDLPKGLPVPEVADHLVQRLWRQEQRHLSPDLGKARCEGRGIGQQRCSLRKDERH